MPETQIQYIKQNQKQFEGFWQNVFF